MQRVWTDFFFPVLQNTDVPPAVKERVQTNLQNEFKTYSEPEISANL
jgi:hypothetical protein